MPTGCSLSYLAFERNYTGQRLDDTGLLYYGARYYDPAAGRFLSPDTLIPDPNHPLDYNRYLYARGNPLKYNDPSGYCATHSDGSPDANDGQCWTMANTITQQWDTWDIDGYWSNRFTSRDVFAEHIAPSPGIGADYLQDEIMRFLESSSSQALSEPVVRVPPPPLDLGDYTALSFDALIFEGSIIRDDFGNWYIRGGIGASVPGWPVVSRGDIYVGGTVDIDRLSLSPSEKGALAQKAMTGESYTYGVTYWGGVGVSVAPSSPHNITVEATVTRGLGASVTRSNTWLIWVAK